MAKLQTAWDLAAQNDSQAKTKSNWQESPTQVLWSGRTGGTIIHGEWDKFQAQWVGGLYTMEEKVTDVNYYVSTPNKRKKSKLYHVEDMVNPCCTACSVICSVLWWRTLRMENFSSTLLKGVEKISRTSPFLHIKHSTFEFDLTGLCPLPICFKVLGLFEWQADGCTDVLFSLIRRDVWMGCTMWDEAS